VDTNILEEQAAVIFF